MVLSRRLSFLCCGGYCFPLWVTKILLHICPDASDSKRNRSSPSETGLIALEPSGIWPTSILCLPCRNLSKYQYHFAHTLYHIETTIWTIINLWTPTTTWFSWKYQNHPKSPETWVVCSALNSSPGTRQPLLLLSLSWSLDRKDKPKNHGLPHSV